MKNLENMIKDNPFQFDKRFLGWLKKNIHIWNNFELKTLTVIGKRPYYSARAICEVIRWETLIYQNDTKREFKLSNYLSADLGRLFMLAHPEQTGFFRTRGTSKREKS